MENKLEWLEYAYSAACRDRDTAWEDYITEKDRLTEEEDRKKSIRERLHDKKSNSWAAYTIAYTSAEDAKKGKANAWATHVKASNDYNDYENERLNGK